MPTPRVPINHFTKETEPFVKMVLSNDKIIDLKSSATITTIPTTTHHHYHHRLQENNKWPGRYIRGRTVPNYMYTRYM